MKINMDKLYDANKVEIKNDVSNIDEILEYEEILLSISKSIIKYRNENNLTQEEFANILEKNQVMVSKLERGNYNPTIKLLYNISIKTTKSTDLFISILEGIIKGLYKTKKLDNRIQFEKHETYKYDINDKQKDITYKYNSRDNYGGMIYGEISSRSRFSINR